MKTIKKNLIMLFSVIAIFCFAVVGVNAPKAFAADGTANEDAYRVYGGSVKIHDDRGAGVKYHVVMTEDYFQTYGIIDENGDGILNDGVKTGTLLLPYHLTGGADLTVGGTYGATVSDSDTSGVWKKVTFDGISYMQSVVYLYNIPETDYGTEISVRGYIHSGDEYIYTAQKNEISMSYVAKAALSNTELPEEDKANLQETYLNKTISYHVNGNVTTETVDYLGVSTECPVPAAKLDDGSEFVGWTTKNGTIIKNVSSILIKNSTDLYATYRRKLLMTDETVALPLENYAEYNVVGIKLNTYDLGSDPAALNVETLKDATSSHGEQNVAVTFEKDGKTFTATLPVLVITKEIASATDFNTIQPTASVTRVFGYYVLSNDIYDANLTKYSLNGWGSEFKATLDGQGKLIGTAGNGGGGLFSVMRDATIKNVTIKDNYRGFGSAALLAKACYNSTIENVTFTWAAGPVDQNVGSGHGWISYSAFEGNKLIDVTVNDTQGYGSLFGNSFKDNSFKNVVINGTYVEMGHCDDQSVSYDDVTQITAEKVTLSARQDFILEGQASLLDLGEYNGLEILSVKTSNGYTLDGISTVTARDILTDKSQHGEQNIVVTVAKTDGTQVEITVPVTIVTKVIYTMTELQDTVKHFKDADNIYGYYILGNDVSWSEDGFTTKQGSNGWSGDKAFKGTLDGRTHTITVNTSKAPFGLFGTLNGATIKDVNIKDVWSGKGWGSAELSYNAYNTTFENVSISIVAGNVNTGSAGYTPFVSHTMEKCVWKNSSITSSVEIVNVFGALKDNDFTGGLTIIANITGNFAVDVSLDSLPDGVVVKKN